MILVASLSVVDWSIRIWSSSLLGGIATALLSLPISLILVGATLGQDKVVAQRPFGDPNWVLLGVAACFVGSLLLGDGENAFMLLAGVLGVTMF